MRQPISQIYIENYKVEKPELKLFLKIYICTLTLLVGGSKDQLHEFFRDWDIGNIYRN